jgi:hypothetical protein
MKLRFVEYAGSVYIVVGMGYGLFDSIESHVLFFDVVPINEYKLIRSALYPMSMKVPFSEAIEITDKKRLLALKVLYG